MEKIKISCDVTPTNGANPVGLCIRVNDHVIFDSEAVTQTLHVDQEIELPEDQENELKIQLKNKTAAHTRVDDQGRITEDSSLVLEHLAFDELELGQIVVENAVYQHDFNGTGTLTQDRFYRDLGCNGTVTLKFNTPVYLWLLERI
jgi:hypothetical protein